MELELAESQVSAYEAAKETLLKKTDKLLLQKIESIPPIKVGSPQILLDPELLEDDIDRCIQAFTGILTFMQKPVLCVCDRFGGTDNTILVEVVGWETKAVLGHIRFDLTGQTINFQTDMYYCPEAIDLLAEIIKNFSKLFPMRATIQAIMYEPIEMVEELEQLIDNLTIEGKIGDYRKQWEKIAFDKPPWDFSEIKVSREDKEIITEKIKNYMDRSPFTRVFSRSKMTVGEIGFDFWEFGYLITLFIKPRIIRAESRFRG